MMRPRVNTSTPKRALLLAAVIMVITTLSGCNTARGFGQDVQKLGSKISHSAS